MPLINLQNNLKLLLLVTILSCFSQSISAQQLAFPTAYGSGAYTSGGRGGIVVHVTNLNNSGPGSLREALQMTVPRTVVFDVSGVITLTSVLGINGSNDNLTIAGQTAPEGGITIEGDRLYFGNLTNLICRYIRFKGGATINNDSLTVADSIKNQIFDHCTFAFGTDECSSWYGTRDGNEVNEITVQRCLFASSSKGSIIGKQENTTGAAPTFSFLFNLFYNANYRFPNITGDGGRFDVINNVSWNTNNRLIRGNGDFLLNHIGNYVDSGNTAFRDTRLNVFRYGPIPQIYTIDNLIIGPEHYQLTNSISEINIDNKLSWKFFQDGGGFNYGDQLPSNYFTDTQHTLLGEPFTILDANEAFTEVLSSVGCDARLNGDGSVSDNKDSLDTDCLSQVEQGNYVDYMPTSEYIVPPIASIVRAANYYVSNSHIPEEWFSANVPSGQDHNDIAPSGYTWLEEFLNQVDAGSIESIGVEAVEISPNTATLNVPETIALEKIFTPADATNKNGVWTSSNESVATVNSSGTVTSISEGEATITFTSNDGGFVAESIITVTNIITPLESVTVSPDTVTLDLNEDLQLTAEFFPLNTTDISGSWVSSDESIVLVNDSGLISSVSEGQATITFIANDGGISDTANVTVEDLFFGSYFLYNANTDLLIQNIENDETINLIDEGNQINFRCIPQGGDTNPDVESIQVTWTGPTSGVWTESVPLYAGLPSGHVDLDFEPYVVEEGTYNFTITYYSEDGALGLVTAVDTFSLTFFFSSLPVANAGPDQDICEGETMTLTASGGTNFLWNNGEATASIEVAPLVTTTYTVTVSDNDGNFDDDSVTITVNEVPIADAGLDQTICEGESATITAIGGTSYLWSTGDTTASIEVNPSIVTTYEVEVISNNCSSTDSVTVFVDPAPIITISDDIIIVDGESTTLIADGSDNYQWSTGETTSFINVTPSVTTTYSVSSVSVNGCSSTEEVTVTVIPEVIAEAGNDSTICRDESVTLTATGGVTYLWNTGDTTAELIVTPLLTSTYTVTVTDDYGYSDTDSLTITVNETPDITVSDDIVIIEGESTTLSVSGSDNYQWSTGDTTDNIVVNPNVTTTYTVISTAVGGCADIEQVTVTVIPEIIADAGEDATICNGEAITLNATGGETYIWNTGDTTSSMTVSPAVTTTYNVTVEDDYGYSDTDSVTVFVNEASNANAGDDVYVMVGNSITLNATGGDTYSWNTGETTASITVNPIVTTIYTVIAFSDSGCQSSDDILVTVVEELFADAGDDVSICLGESVTLNASGGVSYDWNTGDTGPYPTFSPTETTTYSVTIGDGFGNFDTDDITVTVNALPTAYAGEDQTICEGEQVTLTANGGDTYLWSTGDTSVSINVSPDINTTYTVEVFSNNCSQTDNVNVFVSHLPDISVSQDIMIMDGETTELVAYGGTNYQWNTGETTASINVSPFETTTYTVYSENEYGCSSSANVTVIVIPELVANAGEDISICNGDSITLNASGGSTYTWNNGVVGASRTVSPSVTTTYTVSVTDGFGNIDTDSIVVYVNELPNVTVSSNVTIIAGESVSLVANGAETYLWNNGATFNAIIVSPTQTTNYIVSGTSGTCSAEAQVTVTVEEFFEASAGADERVCNNDTYEVALTANLGDSYLWSTGETTQTIVVSPESTTTYTVSVTLGSQQDTDDVTVYVDPNPNVVIVNGDSVDIMNGDFITLSATGANTYEWNNGATQANIAVSPSETTTYEVKGYIGNCYDEKQVTVNVIPEIEADAGDDVIICLDEIAVLTATGGDEYEWSTGETTQTIQVSPAVTTQYTVTVFNALDFDEDSVIVEVDTNCEEDDEEIEIPIGEPEDFSFDIFPNPAKDVVNVKLSGSISLTKVYLYDITGKLIHKARISNEDLINSSTTQINVSSLLPGLYYMKMVDINREISKKLIIK
jgi:hypothetical protein